MERMTWIKPSFNWMMYRSGYASKHNQEHILAIDITREGFEWALAHARLTQTDKKLRGKGHAAGSAMGGRPVRVQWDPERDYRCERMYRTRAIQIGLRGEAVERYVRDWVVRIEDVTTVAHAAQDIARDGLSPETLPCSHEKEYPLPRALAWITDEADAAEDADE